MKLLEYTPLARVSVFLSALNLGDSVLKGNLEAYSCKAAGLDKKYSQNLELEVIGSLASSPASSSESSLGPLSCLASKLSLDEDFLDEMPGEEEGDYLHVMDLE